MFRRMLLVLACLMAGSRARADDGYEALVAQENGIHLFQSGKLAEARAAFEKAHRLAPEKANPERWLGMTEARIGDCKGAIKHLEAFLARIPQHDPREAEAVTVRDRCKADLAPQLGVMVIDSQPPGAEVRLDEENGSALGVTPFRSDSVVAGSHVVFLLKEGFATAMKTVTVPPSGEATLSLSLEEKALNEAAKNPLAEGAVAVERPSLVARVVVGVAALLAIGGGLSLALPVYSEVDGCTPRCSPAQRDGFEARYYAGYALVAAGGAAAIVDAVLWSRVRRKPGLEKRAWWIAPAGSGMGLVVGGKF